MSFLLLRLPRFLLVALASCVFCVSPGIARNSALEVPSTATITVRNFDPREPSCHIEVPLAPSQCDASGCTIDIPNTSSKKTLKLSFSCLPSRAPTGFENPPSWARVISVTARNSRGFVSVVDEVEGAGVEGRPPREINFCLFHGHINLCGSTYTERPKKGKQGAAELYILKTIKNIRFLDDSPGSDLPAEK